MSAPSPHPVDRARLTERGRSAPPVYRYGPGQALHDVVQHYWVPVWDLPAGTVVTEQVLQYPTCLVVVGHDYARFYGVVPGLSSVTLRDRGWVVGVMLRPGASAAVFGQDDLSDLVGTHVDLAGLPHLARVIAPVRQAMEGGPGQPDSHRTAIGILDEALRRVDPPDADGRLLNRVVDLVQSDRAVVSVTQLVDRVGVGERHLQRVTRRFLGIGPKWLIQRRRLHEAAHELKHGDTPLAELAATLGYTDQAHFTRDFARVTGLRPGEFVRTLGRNAPG